MTATVGSVRTYADAALPEVFRWQVLTCVRKQWPDLSGGVVRQPDPDGAAPLHVVLAEGDRLVGYAGLVRTSVRHGGQAWQLDGLGRVFTIPSARGSGQGRRLVDAATEAVRAGSADLGALLCEPGLRPFYGRSGWAEVPPGVLIDDGQGGEPYPVPGPTMLLPVSARARDRWTTFETAPLTVPFAW